MRNPWQAVDRPENRGAVYAIYVEGELTYIGQTVGLCFRLVFHKTKWIGKRPFTVKASYDDDRTSRFQRETRLIRRLRPSQNKQIRTGLAVRARRDPGPVISVRMPRSLRDFYKEKAEGAGRSMNAQIVRALNQVAKRTASKEQSK
jgi:hypothetical protein